MTYIGMRRRGKQATGAKGQRSQKKGGKEKEFCIDRKLIVKISLLLFFFLAAECWWGWGTKL